MVSSYYVGIFSTYNQDLSILPLFVINTKVQTKHVQVAGNVQYKMHELFYSRLLSLMIQDSGLVTGRHVAVI